MKDITINNKTIIDAVGAKAREAWCELWSVQNHELLSDFFGERRIVAILDDISKLIDAYRVIGAQCEIFVEMVHLPSGGTAAMPVSISISEDGEHICDDTPRYAFPVAEWKNEYNAEERQ